ncbi:MAG TPA: FliH/SctL family protein [Acidobacteriaceae bacterium]|jgi:flagellar assembly protein FliH|nr:FliH/SctL family protein [Acidobacteriaceae bacterium]
MSSDIGSIYDVVASLQYRDIAGRPANEGIHPMEMNDRPSHGGRGTADKNRSEAELVARIAKERAEAAAQTEARLRQEMEQKLQTAQMAIAKSVQEFAQQRNDYFTKVEAEIVQLSLSIAAKILHREAQVDPMLVATLVRMAAERMRDQSAVTIRVATGRAASWAQYFSGRPNLDHVQILEDAQLGPDDCLLQTELGSANFSLDAQLKEVEQGFFDLLALRPSAR